MLIVDRRNTVLEDRRAHTRIDVDSGAVKERRRRGRPTRATEPADQRTPVYLTATEKRALERRAGALDTSVSELIRDAVDDYLDDIGESKVFSSTANSKRG